MPDFIICVGHSENIGLLSFVHLPNVDTFHCSRSPTISSEQFLKFWRANKLSDISKFSKALIFV